MLKAEQELYPPFEKGGGGSLVNLLCSRNARPMEGLVGRAQWEINQAAPYWERVTSLERAR